MPEPDMEKAKLEHSSEIVMPDTQRAKLVTASQMLKPVTPKARLEHCEPC